MSKVKLGSVTDSCLGKMLDAAKNKGSYAPYLANINVRWGSFDTSNLSQMRFEDDEQDRYGLIVGDLVMCEGGEPGRCAIWHGEVTNMKIQKALHRIRPHDCLDIRFLYYWFLLAGKSGWLNRYFTETTIKHLPGESLKDVEIDLPSLSSQKGIADVLSGIDEKIALNKRINAELEAMAKTLYDYWFVQFDFPDENGKPYRTSGGAMEYNEQLKREIPKGWSVQSLGNLCSFRNGINYDKNTNGDKSYRIVNVRNITATSLLLDSSELDEIMFQSKVSDNYRVTSNDIIIARSGTPGATRVLINPADNVIFCGFIICCSPYKGYMKKYITYSIKRLEGTAATKTGGSILQNVSQETLKSITVCVPTKQILEKYTTIVSILWEKMQCLMNENGELTRLRDWLLPMLMNGQATVE